MTKLKLMDKMQVLKKQLDEEQKNDTDSDMAVSTRSIGTCHNLQIRTLERQSNQSSLGKIEYSKNIENIKLELKKLKKTKGKQSLGGEIQHLERYKQNMDRMQRKYFLKMIDLD